MGVYRGNDKLIAIPFKSCGRRWLCSHFCAGSKYILRTQYLYSLFCKQILVSSRYQLSSPVSVLRTCSCILPVPCSPTRQMPSAMYIQYSVLRSDLTYIRARAVVCSSHVSVVSPGSLCTSSHNSVTPYTTHELLPCRKRNVRGPRRRSEAYLMLTRLQHM